MHPLEGVGLGLRHRHLAELAVAAVPEVPFWEVAPENLIGQGGRTARLYRTVLERDRVLTHGLSMSLGGFDAWDRDAVRALDAFLRESGSPLHSEQLCWSSYGGPMSHELLPLPFSTEAVHHVVRRARALQARLPVPLALENITYYAHPGEPEMSELSFLTEVLEGADVGWLLDVNNVYVNAQNHGLDAEAWLLAAPLHRVVQIHVAGHELDAEEGCLIDTHGAPVSDPVVELLRLVLTRLGRPVPVVLERDNDVPALEGLLAERAHLQEVYDASIHPSRTPVAGPAAASAAHLRRSAL